MLYPRLSDLPCEVRNMLYVHDGYLVGTGHLVLGSKNLDLPQSARTFVRNFDDGNRVQPFSFQLSVPVI